MAKLSTKKASSTHRAIIFGAPKSGKTQIAGDLAEFYNIIYVGMENGHETLFKLPAEWQERIELVDLKDTRSYPIAIETVLKMVKGPVSICEAHGKVGCMLCKKEAADTIDLDLPALDSSHVVIFDSLTQLTNSAIANITKSQPDDYKLNYDDWGNLGKLLDIFLSHIQQANYNVIVISHETEAETESKKKTLVPVGGTRNFSRNVAKYFDHVIYAERKNKRHVYASSTQYATTVLAGSRTDVSLEDYDKPSLLAIFKPELFAERQAEEAKTSNKAKPIVNKGGSSSDILSRLKNKAK